MTDKCADIVDRLRFVAGAGDSPAGHPSLAAEAAAEIARLRSEVDQWIARADAAWAAAQEAGKKWHAGEVEIARLRADLHEALAELQRYDAENDRLRAALREARQYVSDAGEDEDPETQRHSGGLLAQIDKLLSAGKQI